MMEKETIMKETYQVPELEVIKIGSEDIVTASDTGLCTDPNELLDLNI